MATTSSRCGAGILEAACGRHIGNKVTDRRLAMCRPGGEQAVTVQQHSVPPALSHLMFLMDDKFSGRISEAAQLLVEGLPQAL